MITLEHIIAGQDQLLQAARAEFENRRERERFTFAGLLGEPAWDMMLDLFISWAEGRPTKIKDLCVMSQIADATAHRHLAALEHAGMIHRRRAEHDGRVVIVALTERGIQEMGTYLATRFATLSPDSC